MTESLNIYQKLAKARKFVANLDLKPEGLIKTKQGFVKSRHYTPEQVYSIVTQAEEHAKLICLPLKLVKDESGQFIGTIEVIDIEDKTRLEFSMLTDRSNILNASAVQNMGGTYTYTERYLLISLFRIRGEIVDIDSQPLTEVRKPQNNQTISSKGEISKEEYERRFKQ